MSKLIDPPMGWLYGFPKEIPDEILNSEFSCLLDWLVLNGYPQSQINQFKSEDDDSLSFFHYRIIER